MNYHWDYKKKFSLLLLVLLMGVAPSNLLFSFENPKIMGVIQVLYERNFFKNENSFGSYRTVFGLDGKILKWAGYRILTSLDPKSYRFEGFDFYGRILTPIGEVRIGQFKVPFSMERLISFSERDFVENALATEVINGRDIGIGLYGDKKWIEYNLGLFNGNGMNKKDSNKAKDFVGRIAFKKSFGDDLSFLLGGAIYLGKTGEDERLLKKNLYNLQFRGKIYNFSINSEFVRFENSVDNGDAFYATLGYRLFTNKCTVEPMIRFDAYDSDHLMPDDIVKRITFGINFYLEDYNLRLQINMSKYVMENQGDYIKLFILSQFVFK